MRAALRPVPWLRGSLLCSLPPQGPGKERGQSGLQPLREGFLGPPAPGRAPLGCWRAMCPLLPGSCSLALGSAGLRVPSRGASCQVCVRSPSQPGPLASTWASRLCRQSHGSTRVVLGYGAPARRESPVLGREVRLWWLGGIVPLNSGSRQGNLPEIICWGEDWH